ncbi:MAG: hypothetical protein JW754_02555 [Candidatus Aenigmarchaeota archaeon]|nr:hypothetical protein [Candidatus Aenigmarchaeota archaeon]
MYDACSSVKDGKDFGLKSRYMEDHALFADLVSLRDKIISRTENDKEIKHIIKGTEGYTGTNEPLGNGFFYNTIGTPQQLSFALLMSGHPVVLGLIDNDSVNPENFDFYPLIKESVLSGFRIIDLGCGRYPTFANCVHALGAEIHTSDWKPADEIRFQHADMKKRYVSVDFNKPEAVGMLLEMTGGNFDMVTASAVDVVYFDDNLRIDGVLDERVEEIAAALVRPGGFFCFPV